MLTFLLFLLGKYKLPIRSKGTVTLSLKEGKENRMNRPRVIYLLTCTIVYTRAQRKTHYGFYSKEVEGISMMPFVYSMLSSPLVFVPVVLCAGVRCWNAFHRGRQGGWRPGRVRFPVTGHFPAVLGNEFYKIREFGQVRREIPTQPVACLQKRNKKNDPLGFTARSSQLYMLKQLLYDFRKIIEILRFITKTMWKLMFCISTYSNQLQPVW